MESNPVLGTREEVPVQLSLTDVLIWLLLGLVAGIAAKWLMPGKGPSGWIWTIGLGILGAIVGGFLATHVFGWGGVSGFNLGSLALSIGGAVLILFVYDRVLKK